MVNCFLCIDMRFRSRRSINGVLTGLILVLITLLVLGIVTRRPVFYILFGVIISVIIGILFTLNIPPDGGTGFCPI